MGENKGPVSAGPSRPPHTAVGLADVHAAILPKLRDVPAELGGSGVLLAA